MVNSPEAVAGIQRRRTWSRRRRGQAAANDPYGTMMTLFKEGKVGMIINGPWEVAGIKRRPELRWHREPRRRAGPGRLRPGRCARRRSQLRDLRRHGRGEGRGAIAFVNFMSSAESQAFLAEELGLLPTRPRAYDMPEVKNNPIISRSSRCWRSPLPRPWIPEGGQFFGPLDEMATEVLIQGKDAQTVARRGRRQVQDRGRQGLQPGDRARDTRGWGNRPGSPRHSRERGPPHHPSVDRP